MPPKLTADQVADYFIALAHQRGESVNNSKLQKLLYYAQAWHLAFYDAPLFGEKFEAWIYGPAIPSVYWRFKPFSISDLPVQREPPALDAETTQFLDQVASEYLALDEYELEWLSRREPPWVNARGRLDIDEHCTTELSEEDMRSYFRRLAEAA